MEVGYMSRTRARLLEEANEQLECSVCLEEYTDPRSLVCSHTFCMECLSNIAKDHLLDTGRGRRVETYIICPECREWTILRMNQTLRDLPRPLFLRRFTELRDKLEKEVNASRGSPPSAGDTCDICRFNTTRTGATACCQDCQLNYCAGCLEIHDKNKSFIDHKIIKETSEDSTCPEHPGKRFTSYCTTCRISLCAICVMGMHDWSHEILDLKEATGSICRDIVKNVTSFDDVKHAKGRRAEVAHAVDSNKSASNEVIEDVKNYPSSHSTIHPKHAYTATEEWDVMFECDAEGNPIATQPPHPEELSSEEKQPLAQDNVQQKTRKISPIAPPLVIDGTREDGDGVNFSAEAKDEEIPIIKETCSGTVSIALRALETSQHEVNPGRSIEVKVDCLNIDPSHKKKEVASPKSIKTVESISKPQRENSNLPVLTYDFEKDELPSIARDLESRSVVDTLSSMSPQTANGSRVIPIIREGPRQSPHSQPVRSRKEPARVVRSGSWTSCIRAVYTQHRSSSVSDDGFDGRTEKVDPAVTMTKSSYARHQGFVSARSISLTTDSAGNACYETSESHRPLFSESENNLAYPPPTESTLYRSKIKPRSSFNRSQLSQPLDLEISTDSTTTRSPHRPQIVSRISVVHPMGVTNGLVFDGNLQVILSTTSVSEPIQMFNYQGEKIHSFGRGVLMSAHGITIDNGGRIAVVDRMMKTIKLFNASGTLMHSVKDKEYKGIMHVSVCSQDGENLLAVTDRVTDSVLLYDLRSNQIVKRFTDNSGNLRCAPNEVICGGNPYHIHVQDNANMNIKSFDLSGDLFTCHQPGRRYGNWSPRGITLNAENNLLVADWNNRKVLTFTDDSCECYYPLSGVGRPYSVATATGLMAVAVAKRYDGDIVKESDIEVFSVKQ